MSLLAEDHADPTLAEARATTPEVDHDTLPPPPGDPQTLPSLQIASVQWSLHVSKLYLDFVRSFQLTQLAQAVAHTPRTARRGNGRRP